MCKMLEDMRNDVAIDIAQNLIKADNVSLEQIANATSLPLDTVKKLEAEIMSLA